jgi:methyl-accepting chemotaxis protein
VIFPMLLFYEVFLCSFLLLKRQMKTYMIANVSVMRALRNILEKRKVVQKLRRVSDRSILTNGDFSVRSDVLSRGLISAVFTGVNRFIDTYWKIFRRLC